jgi:hypothetical protein
MDDMRAEIERQRELIAGLSDEEKWQLLEDLLNESDE